MRKLVLVAALALTSGVAMPGIAQKGEVIVESGPGVAGAATPTVSVRGPQRTVDLSVRDPAQFKLIAKGDQVETIYVEATATAVTPAMKK
jgi:hypothetical protein